MRIRTGHGPNDWREAGPQSVTARVASFGALTGAAMIPPLTYFDQPVTAAETARRARKRQKRQDAARIARELNPPPKVVCGELMRYSGDTCARRPGHHDSHRSRVVMDYDRDARPHGSLGTDG